MEDPYALWWWFGASRAVEIAVAMLGTTPAERQRKAEALRRQFRIIKGDKV